MSRIEQLKAPIVLGRNKKQHGCMLMVKVIVKGYKESVATCFNDDDTPKIIAARLRSLAYWVEKKGDE